MRSRDGNRAGGTADAHESIQERAQALWGETDALTAGDFPRGSEIGRPSGCGDGLQGCSRADPDGLLIDLQLLTTLGPPRERGSLLAVFSIAVAHTVPSDAPEEQK